MPETKDVAFRIFRLMRLKRNSSPITAYCFESSKLLGRKEVLTGKAKFGIFGDGKNYRNWF